MSGVGIGKSTQINPLNGPLVKESSQNLSKTSDGSIFKGLLEEKAKALSDTQSGALKKSIEENGIKFSQHAMERIQSRGIKSGPELLKKLTTALDKAINKGSKDTLVLTDEAAFILNIKNKTVVTALDRGMMKENLFTNIDSTIFV